VVLPFSGAAKQITASGFWQAHLTVRLTERHVIVPSGREHDPEA